MATMVFAYTLLSCLGFSVVLPVAYIILNYLTSPLKSIPGPFLAKFTNFWRLWDTYNGRAELTHRLLHEKYGSAVRIGPNAVSLSDPSLIRTIYTIKGEYIKTRFYDVNAILHNGQLMYNLFSTQDNAYHKKFRSPIQKYYSMTHLLAFEPLVDRTITYFLQRLEEEFVNDQNARRPCDLHNWLLYYAWDVVGEITFSSRIGFLEKGGDVQNILETSEKGLDYFAPIAQIPQLDYLFDKNPIHRFGPPSFGFAADFSAQKLFARYSGEDKHVASAQPDFLDRFIELKENVPELVDDNQIVSYLLINVIAGSDTTAATLRAVIYYVLKNPRVLKKLRAELVAANLSVPVSYRAVRDLEYFDAVCREAMRMHPGVGLLLERHVPEGGLVLPNGTFLREGTIVGMNPWVIHMNKEVFGEDAASYMPERWLPYEGESKEDFEGRKKRMKEMDLTFGAGNRYASGRI